MLDASKAFDTVHFGKLFKLLMDRKLPAMVIRLLLDNYTRQNICTTWNGAKSDTFTAMNGVRQGGVLSPILFTIYFDEMIYKLEKSGIGCKIGIHFIGALAYADDVILLCPSRSGLQSMLTLCETFGIEFRVSFNAKKTQCIQFSLGKITQCGPVYLNNNVLKWKTTINHLGNKMTQRLDDDIDLTKKKSHFVGSVNKMFSNFNNVQSAVLIKLFKRYCCSFYGCTLWKLNDVYDDKLCTEWNKAIRKVWKLPTTAHRCVLGPLSGQLHIFNQFVIRFIQFYNRLVLSDNPIVNFIARSSMSNRRSYLRNNILFVKWKFGIDMHETNVTDCIKGIKQACEPDIETLSVIDMLKELIDARDGFTVIPHLSKNDITESVIFLSTANFI